MINLMTLVEMLPVAQAQGYAVGAFSPRNTILIRSVLEAAEQMKSPVIVQISENELHWFSLTAETFAKAFYHLAHDYSVPAVLHLDHTRDMKVILAAIDAGFTSVMIDASNLPLDENIKMTSQVVRIAHKSHVSVEAELGRIPSSDNIETNEDSLFYTDPEEAAFFVDQTGVDALAVSIGTAHGIYRVKQPRIDLERLIRIRQKTNVPLVLHGGSGLPAETIKKAILLPMGGISKVNIATDLEIAFQRVTQTGRLSQAEVIQLDPEKLKEAINAVMEVVAKKMRDYICSAGHACDYAKIRVSDAPWLQKLNRGFPEDDK